MTRQVLTRAAGVALVAAICAGCSEGGSPTAAAGSSGGTVAAVAGQYSGSYRMTGCAADGGFVGFCEGQDLTTTGTALPIILSLNQTQSSVTGTLTLGSLSGTFQGSVAGGTISGTASMNDVTDEGVIVKTTVNDWSTTLSGNALSGGFKVVLQASTLSGSATLTATVQQLMR